MGLFMYMAIVLLWVFLGLLAMTWVWVLYVPFRFILRLIPKPLAIQKDSQYQPLVSIIIVAHNEEQFIKRRIENLMLLDYPNGCLEIIVACDASTGNTNHYVEELRLRYGTIRLVALDKQGGRAHVHNTAITHACGDIVVFTDAETEFAPDFLTRIVPLFSDERVGCVCGRLYYRNKDQSYTTEAAGLYWQFESLVRRLESDCSILRPFTCCLLQS